MSNNHAVIDITQLAPRDELLRAARAVLCNYTDVNACFESTEKVMDDLREAIRRVELEPGPGGWIVWRGGACPVDHDAIVDISRACGQIEMGVVAGHYSWGHFLASADRDITAYRPSKSPVVIGSDLLAAAQHEDAHGAYHLDGPQ